MPDAALSGAQAIVNGGGASAPDASLAGAQNLLATTAVTSPAAAEPVVTNPYLGTLEQENAEQQRLEQEHGKFATVATQAARGVLDFVMAPAALLGAGLQGVGSVTGWDGLRDFGQDFGHAAQGSEAMATLFNPSVISTFGNGQEALTSYEKAARDIAEQQQAWPMLSSVSHAAGMIAAGVGVGAVAGAGTAAAEGIEAEATQASTALSRVAGAAGMGAYEGAASGAQSAYAENRPLRDVLGSTLMGGLMGGATAGLFQGGSELLSSSAFTEGLENFGRERAGKALGIIQRDRNALGGSEDVDRLVKDVTGYTLDDGSPIIPKGLIDAGRISQSEIADRVAKGAEETGAKLGNMRRAVSEFIDTEAPDLRPNVDQLIDKIKTDALDELEKSPILRSRATAIRDVLDELEGKATGPLLSKEAASAPRDISLNELRSIQENLKSKLYPKTFTAVPEAKLELQKVERLIEDTIENTVDRALPKMVAGEAGSYRELRRVARSFIQANDIAERAMGRQAGNRFHSLSDTLAGTATFAGDIATGGPIVAGAKALGIATLHKYAREHGSAFLSALAEKAGGVSRRLASGASSSLLEAGEAGLSSEAGRFGAGLDSRYISVDAAQGREAQSVIAHLERARQSVNNAVEKAGPNPVVRQAAQAEAAQEFASRLAEKAGPFDPVTWQQVPPNPLQKVLHRPEILNQVSADLAKGAARVAALKPSPDLDLNGDRIRKLIKDANGPLAIGGVQQAVRDIGTNVPISPTGDQLRLVARAVVQHLNDVDTSGAMLTGHELARKLSELSDGASDQVTKNYIADSVGKLQQALSSASFGKAGAVYGKLTAAPDPTFQHLLDPAAVREMLRMTDTRGQTPGALQQLTQSVLDAHEAAKQLGGPSNGKDAAKQTRALAEQFSAAQDAVTLDGGPAGRVFDFFSGKMGADATGLRGAPQTIVLNAIRPQMERMLPALGKASDRYTGEPDKPSHPEPPKSSGELQSLYRERMANLSSAVNQPNPDAVASSLKGLPNIPPDVTAAVGIDAQQRMAQLLQDMPRPTQSIRGKAFETLSSNDLRRADAMWEATTKPMSVFSDFHSGTIDYDKAQYAWKQYPGLQQAAQAGLMDALHAHLDDDERANIPDSTLTQLDYLLGFNGSLQPSVDRGFASRMTAIAAQQAQEQPKQNAQLDLATSKPTYTERLAQARKG